MRRLYRAETRQQRREGRALGKLEKKRNQLAREDDRVLGEIVTPTDPDGRGLRTRVVVERSDGSLTIVRPGRLERESF